jgi:hypothetical protein
MPAPCFSFGLTALTMSKVVYLAVLVNQLKRAMTGGENDPLKKVADVFLKRCKARCCSRTRGLDFANRDCEYSALASRSRRALSLLRAN